MISNLFFSKYTCRLFLAKLVTFLGLLDQTNFTKWLMRNKNANKSPAPRFTLIELGTIKTSTMK